MTSNSFCKKFKPSRRKRLRDFPLIAGLIAAGVAKRPPNGTRITQVDRHNYHLFTPLLYQVAAWGLDPYNAAYPTREVTGPQGID